MVHELGHALVAKLVHSRVAGVRIGRGPLIARFSIGATRFEVRCLLVEGVVHHAPIGARHLRARLAAVHVAGVTTAIAFALALSPFVGREGRVALAWAGAYQLFNLLPRTLRLSTGKTPSDGVNLFRVLFRPRAYLPARVRAAFVQQYYEQVRVDDWDGARETAEEFRRTDPGDNTATILLSCANWHFGTLDGIDVDAVLRLWPPPPTFPFVRHLLAQLTNFVAYQQLVTTGNCDGALLDALRRSHEIAPTDIAITDTLAWAAVESGAVEEGIALSDSIAADELDDERRAGILAVRAIANGRAGRFEEATALREAVVALDPELPVLRYVDRAIDGSSTPFGSTDAL